MVPAGFGENDHNCRVAQCEYDDNHEEDVGIKGFPPRVSNNEGKGSQSIYGVNEVEDCIAFGRVIDELLACIVISLNRIIHATKKVVEVILVEDGCVGDDYENLSHYLYAEHEKDLYQIGH